MSWDTARTEEIRNHTEFWWGNLLGNSHFGRQRKEWGNIYESRL
jgi:hypothetical protein